MDDVTEDLNEDPKPDDESDPEYHEEMFRTYRLGWTPETFPNREYATKYAEWLKTSPAEDE